EHNAWLEDLEFALNAGRIVRALRLASRPPKPGTTVGPEIRARLVEGAKASLTAEVTAERWAAVLDAVAYAPVRAEVEPSSIPEAPGEELLAAVRKYAGRVPKVAAAFGIEPPAPKPQKGLRARTDRRRSGAV